jgi:molybdopterin-guanine dinucleotide biosynthesis protein A
MQRDKAALEYGGQAQLDRAFDLVGRHVPRVFVSVREDQTLDPTRARRPLIVDSAVFAEETAAGGTAGGPIVGIRSALAAFPDVAWLVVACDLPFLSDTALKQLLAQRDPGRLATAFLSTHDGLPEPLCAVWEPAAAVALAAHQRAGRSCPRKFLINHPVKLLEPEDRRALDNINTPAEYAAARGAHPMQLSIQYFALLREQAGRSQETLETVAATPADLYAELQDRYGFTLPREQLKVAVNSDFSDWSRRLVAGDSVVFIPPVAGG